MQLILSHALSSLSLSDFKYTIQLEEVKHSSPTYTQHHTVLVN